METLLGGVSRSDGNIHSEERKVKSEKQSQRILGAGYVGEKSLVTGHWSLVTNHWLLVINNLLFIIISLSLPL